MKAVVTDNGSNMVRTFKEHIMVTDEEEEQDDSEEDSGQEDQERYCGLEEMGDQQEGEEEGDQQIQQEKEIDRLVVAEVSGDPGLGYDPDNNAEEFADREREHVLAFGGSCFAHTIQLVLLKFNKDKRVAAVLKKVTSVVKKFNMSKNATEQLVNEAGVSTLTSAKFHPTLSSVIPSVMLIEKHLKEVVDKKSFLSCVAKDMLHDTESRFNMLLDHKHKDHQPLYAIATFLDVRYKSLIKGTLLNATKQVIIKDLGDANDGTSETESDEGSLDREEPPESKHYRMDRRIHKLLLQEDDEMEEEDNPPKR